jgi:hypothetical protein
MVTGGMAEWLKAAVLKTVNGVTRSGVRIPLPPPQIFLEAVLQLKRMLSKTFQTIIGGCEGHPDSDIELQTLAGSWLKLELGGTYLVLDAHKPNHFYFRTSCGAAAGYFDGRLDGDGAVKLFRNRRAGSPEEEPIRPEDAHEYLKATLRYAHAVIPSPVELRQRL